MPTVIDPRFVDVDFSQEPQYVFGNRGTGTLGVVGGTYAEAGGVVYPESDWPKIAKLLDDSQSSLDYCVTRLFDQKQEGSCASNALTQIHEIIQCLQFGADKVTHLSAISLYKRVADSADSGSVLSDNVEEVMKNGIVPLDDDANKKRFGSCVMPNTGFKTQFPATWKDVAVEFRIHELLEITTLAELVSAQFSGHPVYVGREGHSIVYVKPHYDGGILYNGYVNSYSEQWGQALGNFKSGFGFDTRRQMQKSVDAGAYAVRSIRIPSFLSGAFK